MSAARISDSTLVPCSGETATPIDAPMSTLCEHELERLGDGEHHAARDPLDLGDRIDLREEHGELVAGEAREQRPGAGIAGELGIDHDAQPVGDHDQQLIAAGMAEAVVDLLEPVEIDEQHRRLGRACTIARSACPLPNGSEAGWEGRSPGRTCRARAHFRSRL